MARSNTQLAARGFVWSVIQTLVNRFGLVLSQIILARLLLKEDFGIAALALMVTALTYQLQKAGIAEVLVLRQKRLHLWASPAFWLSVTMGLVSALILLACAPVIARLNDEPRILRAMMLLAPAAIFDAMSTVPMAMLTIRLRYRAQAAIQTITVLFQLSLAMGLAWLWHDDRAWAPMALIIPLPATAALRFLLAWWIGKPPVTWRPRVGVWKHIFRESGLFLCGSMMYAAIAQADYFILGIFSNAAVVGEYSKAFELSRQGMSLLGSQMGAVAFSILAKMKGDPHRQGEAFARLISVNSALTVPLFFTIGLSANSIVRLLLGPGWEAVGPMMTVLCFGVTVQAVNVLSGYFVNAIGDFKLRLGVASFNFVGFVILVSLGTWWAGSMGTAIGVTAFYMVIGPLGVRMIVRRVGLSLRAVYGPMIPLYLIAGGTALVAWQVERLALGTPEAPGVVDALASLGLRTAIFLPLFAALTYLLARKTFVTLKSEWKAIRRRRTGSVTPAATT